MSQPFKIRYRGSAGLDVHGSSIPELLHRMPGALRLGLVTKQPQLYSPPSDMSALGGRALSSLSWQCVEGVGGTERVSHW